MATWCVIGCGYVGRALASQLVGLGHDVVVTRRDRAAAEAAAAAVGGRGLALDLAKSEPLVLPDNAIVVCCAPPGAAPAAELARLVAAAPKRLVYVSSTGVYAPGGGAWVDEQWPVAPETRSGKARVIAERALRPEDLVLRVAGIYGPKRGIVERIRAGTYRIVGDGSLHVSRIHVADLVEAIVCAGATTAAGHINVADDDPAPIGEVADAIAARMGFPPPLRVPVDSVDTEVAGMLTADRRISNAKMKRVLGARLRYPSWRDALREAS